jgi:hypothetical protein
LGFVKYIHFKACNGSASGDLFSTHTIPRSAWSGFVAVTALALALSAESLGVSGQEAKARPLPPGVAACDFGALANDHTREGLNIRAEPRADSTILGRLPVIENAHHEKIAADVHVIGVRNGWFFIEDAGYGDYDLPKKLPPVYGGHGWVSGKLLTTQLRMMTLKAAPDENAADVVEMVDYYGVKAISIARAIGSVSKRHSRQKITLSNRNCSPTVPVGPCAAGRAGPVLTKELHAAAESTVKGGYIVHIDGSDAEFATLPAEKYLWHNWAADQLK